MVKPPSVVSDDSTEGGAIEARDDLVKERPASQEEAMLVREVEKEEETEEERLWDVDKEGCLLLLFHVGQ
jgi:hypothetical protein